MACARLDTSDILEDGKNLKQIVCPRCGSKILPPKMGTYEETEFELQSMKKESAGTVELLDQFFRVEDMFDFDNMGFTNTVEHIKFLSCGDCEVGPLGYHNLQTKKSYLALASILHLSGLQCDSTQDFLHWVMIFADVEEVFIGNKRRAAFRK